MLFGLISPTYSLLLGILISFFLVFRAKLDGLLGLFFLQLSPYYFYDVSESPLEDSLREVVKLGSFPLTIETLLCGFIFIRVLYQIFTNPKIFQGKVSNILLLLWIIAFIPVTFGTYAAYISELSNWSRGMRWFMISSAYFYGIILVRNDSKLSLEGALKAIYIVPSLFVTILIFFGMFWSHHVFLMIGFGVALGCFLLRSRRWSFVALGTSILFFLLQYSLSGSFTMYGIFFASIGLIIMSDLNFRNNLFFGKYINCALIIIPLTPIFFTIFILWAGHLHGDIDQVYYAPLDSDVFARLYSKIIYDRYPFWQSAWNQIMELNYLTGNTGAPLELNVLGLPDKWEMGAHNAVLEILRVDGIFSGLVILFIYITALYNLKKILLSRVSRFMRYFSAAILAVGVIGMSTGDFPADMTVGFWLWCFAGLSYGIFLKNLADKHCEEFPYKFDRQVAKG
jgi:hypothetical protein